MNVWLLAQNDWSDRYVRLKAASIPRGWCACVHAITAWTLTGTLNRFISLCALRGQHSQQNFRFSPPCYPYLNLLTIRGSEPLIAVIPFPHWLKFSRECSLYLGPRSGESETKCRFGYLEPSEEGQNEGDDNVGTNVGRNWRLFSVGRIGLRYVEKAMSPDSIGRSGSKKGWKEECVRLSLSWIGN